MSTIIVEGVRRKFRPLMEWYAQKLADKRQTVEGAELPDPVPVAPPIGYNRQPTMVEHIRNLVRSEELRRAAAAAGAETFEEADDFDVADDTFPVSSFEAQDDLEPVAALRAKKEAAETAEKEAVAKPPTGADPVAAPPAAPAAS